VLVSLIRASKQRHDRRPHALLYHIQRILFIYLSHYHPTINNTSNNSKPNEATVDRASSSDAASESERLAWREAFISEVSAALTLEYANISDIQVSRVMRTLFSAARRTSKLLVLLVCVCFDHNYYYNNNLSLFFNTINTSGYGVQIEPNFATLVVGTAVLEGVGRQLNPRLSLLDAAVPVLLRRHALLMRERVSLWLPDDCSYQ
jgi:hypothetical protein